MSSPVARLSALLKHDDAVAALALDNLPLAHLYDALLTIPAGVQIVALFVMPVFAFANAGVNLGGFALGDFLSPVPLGIAAGLVVGKQLGIFGLTWAGVRLGLLSGSLLSGIVGYTVLRRFAGGGRAA